MFCPKCSQRQFSADARFCSRCGFLLTGIAEVLANDGLIPKSRKTIHKPLTLRKRGFKQGLFALLLLVLTSPILLIIAREVEIHPAPVFLTLFILFVSCIIRMIYALMFESNDPAAQTFELPNDYQAFPAHVSFKALASPPLNPLSDFAAPVKASWHASDELAFQNVTNVTTKQLDK